MNNTTIYFDFENEKMLTYTDLQVQYMRLLKNGYISEFKNNYPTFKNWFTEITGKNGTIEIYNLPLTIEIKTETAAKTVSEILQFNYGCFKKSIDVYYQLKKTVDNITLKDNNNKVIKSTEMY